MKPNCSMRSLAALTLCVLAIASCDSDGDGGNGSAGGCVAPTIVSSEEVAIPGAEMLVHGEAFIDGCIDHAGNGTPAGTSTPYESVEIVITQGDQEVLSQQVVPDANGAFDLALMIPVDLGSDPVTITAPDVPGTEVLTVPVATQ